MKLGNITESLFLKVIPLIWKVAPVKLLLVFVIRLLEALQPAVQIYLTKALVDEVSSLIQGTSDSFQMAMMILLAQALLYSADLGLKSLGHLFMFDIKQKAKYTVDHQVAEKCASIAYIYFEQPQYYDKLQRVSQGLAYRGLAILDHFFQLFKGMVTLVSLAAALAGLHFSFIFGMIFFIVPTFWIHVQLGKKRFAQMVHQTPTSRKVHYIMRLLTERESAKEVRMFRLFSYLKEKWSVLYWNNATEQYRLERTGVAYQLFADIISYAVTLASIIYFIYLSSEGVLTLGYFVALIETIAVAKTNTQAVSIHLSQIYEEALFTNELFEFLALPEGGYDRDQRPLRNGDESGLKVEGLTFCYPNQDDPVLKNISFHISPGQKVAIVGKNGAGKSTLVKCIMGLYEPKEGTILYNGVNIQSIEGYEQKVSAVFQDFMKYQLTVKENIGFGDIDSLDDRASLESAAARSELQPLIDSLPLQYDTELGPEYEGGRELSHGQWQKVALSRSYMNVQAEMVIYDEPTAALDPMAEAAMFEKFAGLARNKTSIIISHRLGSCRDADVILVLKDGCLIESGTHDQLMALGQEYAAMFKAQSRWYEGSPLGKEAFGRS
ncbi:ABC transporter ATP-binding protein [Marinicrinis lubricantis]|uniref:ABC transporter ATP-binding protein n=1 Tax=Marinicrinis lubricantis TaxID=2086470 RepID=A0ABW1IKA3_9BACL